MKDEKNSAVTNSEGKEEIVNVKMMRMAQITRERNRKNKGEVEADCRLVLRDKETFQNHACL